MNRFSRFSIVSGIFFLIVFRRDSVTLTGLTSVSGYIRDEPGLGRAYFDVRSGSGVLVSAGTPSTATLALSTTASSASLQFSFEEATRTTASCSPALTNFLNFATSVSVIPYLGSSSVWNIPPTPPQNLA